MGFWEALLQIRSVQRKSWREGRWSEPETGASSQLSAQKVSAIWAQTAGECAIRSKAGDTSWILGRSAGATMIGASASSKLVSGASTRGTAEAKIAAPSRKKINIARNRMAVITTSAFNLLRAGELCQWPFLAIERKLSAKVTTAALPE